MKLSGFCKIVPILAFIVLTVSASYGSPIVVDNFSFEDSTNMVNPCGPGCSYSTTVPTGWSGKGGTFQPGTGWETGSGYFSYFNEIPDGVAVAYSDFDSIFQLVNATVEEGIAYTLLVDWGLRNDRQNTPLGGAGLLIGDSALVLADGIAPEPGNWSTYTATYVGTAADAGKSITIKLSTGNQNIQGSWDNVRLDATPWSNGTELSRNSESTVPEPASYELLATGLLALASVGRLRQAL